MAKGLLAIQYTMTLRKGPKDPDLQTLIIKMSVILKHVWIVQIAMQEIVMDVQKYAGFKSKDYNLLIIIHALE